MLMDNLSFWLLVLVWELQIICHAEQEEAELRKVCEANA
jgi:hypothetical protein